MTLKEIFARAPRLDCLNIGDLGVAQEKLISLIPDLVLGDAATIGYIDAKGDYYCPDLDCNVNRGPLDAEFLQGVCHENMKTERYVDVAFPIRLAWLCGKDDKYI